MSEKQFNPLVMFAKRGTGFRDGKERVLIFFQKNKDSKERTEFLKNEFGIGGFCFNSQKPNTLTGGYTSSKGIKLRYNSDTNYSLEKEYKWKDLSECIAALITKGEYM